MSKSINITNDSPFKKLSEVCTYSKGKKPVVLKETKTKDCNVPYINIKAFEKGIISEYTNGEKCNICNDDDLLMVWDGARCGLIGKAKKGAVGSTLMKILPYENIHKEYLYHFISSKFWTLNTKPKGVGIPHIEPTLLWNFELVVPPIPEQQAIVAKIEELLSELENGKQQLLTAQQQLKVYRQSLLKWAFEGKLSRNYDSSDLYDKNDLKNNTSKNNHGNQNNHINQGSDKGELPKGWKIDKLGDVVINLDGKRRPLSRDVRSKRKGQYRYYGATEIVDFIDDYIYDGEYLLIGEDGANLLTKSRPLAFIAVGQFWVNNHAHVLQTKDWLLLKYLCYYFNSINIAQFVSGSAQPKLNQANMNKIPIPYPCIEEQQLIVSELESKLTVCDKMEETIDQSLQQAETLRQSILKKAFEGELVKNHGNRNIK